MKILCLTSEIKSDRVQPARAMIQFANALSFKIKRLIAVGSIRIVLCAPT